MVDYNGNWTYRKSTPPDRMCDMDRIALIVERNGYEPFTTMEEIVLNIANLYNGLLEDEDVECYAIPNEDDNFNEDDIECFVFDNGGFSEFDYYC